MLAGFMRLLSPHFIKEYKNRIMNIHPALLPSFKGTHGIKDALEYGVKVTGADSPFRRRETGSRADNTAEGGRGKRRRYGRDAFGACAQRGAQNIS